MAIATTAEVQDRMGVTFTAAQTSACELLLDSATALVADAVGKDDDWAAALSPVPAVVKAITIEIVRRAMSNPGGLTQQSQQLGQFQQSESYRRDAGELMLTSLEGRQLRRAVFGSSASIGSVRVGSIIDQDLVAESFDGLDDWYPGS